MRINLTNQERLCPIRLKLLLAYAFGKLIWRVNRRGHVKAGDRAGLIIAHGYRAVKIDQRSYLEHRLVWFYHYGVWPVHELDHINSVRDDNRIENLREATRSQNLRNRGGELGVSLHKTSGLWRPRIQIDGKEVSLKYFKTKEEALAVRKLAEKIHFGEYAHAV